MKWDDIFGRFLDWTPGAVRAHWHILQGKWFVKAAAISSGSPKPFLRSGEGGEGGDSPCPQKQQRPPAYREDLSSSPPIPPILNLDSQYP